MTTTAQKFGFLDDPIVNAIEWAQRNTANLIKAALLRFSGPVGALQKLDNSPTEFFEEVLVRASGGVLGAGALALLGAGALPVAAGAIASSGLASLVRDELLDILDSNPDTNGLAFSKGLNGMDLGTGEGFRRAIREASGDRSKLNDLMKMLLLNESLIPEREDILREIHKEIDKLGDRERDPIGIYSKKERQMQTFAKFEVYDLVEDKVLGVFDSFDEAEKVAKKASIKYGDNGIQSGGKPIGIDEVEGSDVLNQWVVNGGGSAREFGKRSFNNKRSAPVQRRFQASPEYRQIFSQSPQQFGLLDMIGLGGGGDSGSPFYNQVKAELKRINSLGEINEMIDAKATLKREIERAEAIGEITRAEFVELSRMVMAG